MFGPGTGLEPRISPKPPGTGDAPLANRARRPLNVPGQIIPWKGPPMAEQVADGRLGEFLQRLITRRTKAFEEREELRSKRQAIVDVAQEAGAENLSDEEDAEFRSMTAEIKRLDTEVEGLDERIAETSDELQRSSKLSAGVQRLRQARSQLEHVHEQAIYTKGDPRRSYLADLCRVSVGLDTTGEAVERLRRHAQDVATLPEYRDLTRVDGDGGWGVPPIWLMDQYVTFARPGRAFANLCVNEQLPPGTDNINIPKMTTGTTVAPQTADNATVSDTDLTDENLSAPVKTISGQQGVAIQLLEQSPIAFDQVVFKDLIAAHAAVLDKQTLAGTGLSGQVLGVHGTSGIGTVAVSAVTIQGVYSAIANAIQTVHTARFMPPEVIVMHPRRWGWFLSLLDNQDRPLFLPGANGLFNAAGVLERVDSQQVVGQMHGLPVVTDPNIGTAYGTGTNEDLIYVMRASDLYLWESGIRARALYETKAANLTVLLQIYNYLAFQAGRYPQSVVEITGLTAPTWA
jgi:HK97 family phage major capsid protein